MENLNNIKEVVKKHHGYLKTELPEIERLAYTIFKVHFEDSGDFLEQVYRLFGKLKNILEVHIIKEERGLFNMMMDYEKSPSKELLEEILKGIEDIESDFDIAEGVLKELRKATNDYQLPSSSCATFEKTYNKLQELESDLIKHRDLESNIIFKSFK